MQQPNRRFITETLEARLQLTSATSAAIEQFNLSPALFVENDGQWTDESVRFVHQGKGASIAMTDRGPIFELYKEVGLDGGASSGGAGVPPVILDPKDRFEFDDDSTLRVDGRRDARPTGQIESTRFSVSFQNSNITTPIGHDRSTSTFNYNVGNPEQHRSNVHGFEKIVYPNLYNGIDLHTWGQRDSLKYEFHVAPNIDYRQIKVQYEGVEDLWIDDRGRLHAELGNGFGEVIDDSPVIYQLVKGKRVDVAGRFKLLGGDAGGDAYTFELGKFDPKLPLVIDPDLAWGSYLGGASYDWGMGISADSFGNVYVACATQSSSGGFVVKLSASGQHEWTTFLDSFCYSIAIDTLGNVYATGGGVTKLSSSGQFLWSRTGLAQISGESGNSVATDSDGNVYVTGYRSVTAAGMEMAVTKINPTGTYLWSKNFGGTNNDYGYGIAIDSVDDIYVTGKTQSSGWVNGGFDTSHDGGTNDAFVLKLNSMGEHVWSTYLGGTSSDYGNTLVTGANGNVYVSGTTASSGWVSGGFDTSHNGAIDAFVANLSSTGEHMWSTYLGGSHNENGRGVVIDVSGNMYVTGDTLSSGWVNGGFDTIQNSDDAFVVKLSAIGQHVWSTYLGGANSDAGSGITIDTSGNVYVTGWTKSSSWLTGGFDTSHNGNDDIFVAKITDQSDTTIPVFENSTFNYLTTPQQTLTATFNENISASLAATDFVLTNLNTNTTVPLTLQSIAADGQSATFTFSATGNDLGGTILTDGHYRIRALAGQIEDEAGNALAEDVDHFFEFKSADVALQDQIVNFSDLLVVAQHYGLTGATFADGDVNYDGEVNFTDLLAVAQRYGTSIPELRINRFNPTPTKSRSIAGDVFGSEVRIV